MRMPHQNLKNKKGEVEFRKNLAFQFSGKKKMYSGEPSETEYISIIIDRIKTYRAIFKKFNKAGILKSPFLEIGAGVAQGSLLLTNEFRQKGYASDISAETLSLAKKFQKTLKYKKGVDLICSDVYNLPFKDGSISFVFCFQTLHHFPDPAPILTEIRRVLAPGGYFYFGEEPVSQAFNLNLWRRDMHLTWWEKLLKATTLLHFISRIGKSEVENDILEETFDLATWERALKQFGQIKATVKIFPFGPSFTKTKNGRVGWLRPDLYLNLLLKLLGGGIEAICQKAGMSTSLNSPLLSCPNCQKRSYLKLDDKSLRCPNCKKSFVKRQGVWIILSDSQEKYLYG